MGLFNFIVELSNYGGHKSAGIITSVKASSISEARKLAESKYKGTNSGRVTQIPSPKK
jgi:hypothetical protein